MNDAVLEYRCKDQTEEAVPGSPINEIRVHAHASIPELEAEIESSKNILKLPDDWDGEGSPGYSKNTLERAITFVRTHVERLWETFGINAPVPNINPGPMGSIDLHWKEPTWELLVNIPAEETQRASFYGDDYGTGTIKGNVDAGRPNFGLLAWLMK